LSQATRSIQRLRDVQGAARDLARGGAINLGPDPNHPGQQLPNVPNGLVDGGLVPDSGLSAPGAANPVTTWTGARTPTQTTSSDGAQTNVNIEQTAPRAILNWQTFNVGRDTTVNFDQSAGGAQASQWTALNRVLDPTARPSQILGSINAEGSVYLINPNGVIFGGSSQVSVHTLIASSLDLSPAMFAAGLLDPQTQFTCPESVCGAVSVAAGAELTSSGGGGILLLGPQVTNAGTLTTPGGQTVLAAGSAVQLEQAPFLQTAATSGIPAYLGFRPIVTTNAGDTSPNLGALTNSGVISAPTGNISLIGRTVNQDGAVLSSTSTSSRGSIIIQALDAPGTSVPLGALAFGTGSVTQVLPDLGDIAQITDAQPLLNSFVQIQGNTIQVAGSAGDVNGAIIQIRGYDPRSASSDAAQSLLVHSNRVLLESGSLLDVAGTTDAVVSASRNSVSVNLGSNELADSPAVRESPIFRQSIFVDASETGTRADGTTYVGTPLADAAGSIAVSVTRTLSERLAGAGSIAVNSLNSSVIFGNPYANSASDFVALPGANINLSGGFVTFTGGFVRVSTLVTESGQLISASSADATNLQRYIGIIDGGFVDSHPRFGVAEVYTSPRTQGFEGYFQDGYVQGANAGTLSLGTNTALLGATVNADAVVGVRQLTPATRPRGGVLNVGLISQLIGIRSRLENLQIGAATPEIDITSLLRADGSLISNSVSAVRDSEGHSLTGLGAVPQSWLTAGFSTYNLISNDTLTFASNSVIDVGVAGTVTAASGSIQVGGSIFAPGGTISLTAGSVFPTDVTTGASIDVGPGAILSTAGLWINQFGGGSPRAPSLIANNGGSIRLSSQDGVRLQESSLLDVSAGGQINARGGVSLGNAGSIGLTLNTSVLGNAPLQLFGEVRGYGLAFGTTVSEGGSLSISAPFTRVTVRSAEDLGGEVLVQGQDLFATLAQPFNRYTADLADSFFSRGGFREFSVTGQQVAVAAGANLEPHIAARVLDQPQLVNNSDDLSALTLASQFAIGVLPPAARVSLTAQATVETSGFPGAGSLDVEQGARIAVGAGGRVNLVGVGRTVISGTVEAPAGTITVRGGDSSAEIGGAVFVTGSGQLLARGTEVSQAASNGVIYQDVLAGGTVTVQSLSGPFTGNAVVLAPGSIIDVSGAEGTSSLPQAGSDALVSGVRSVSPTSLPTYSVGSAGGTINILASVGAAIEGDRGFNATTGARGGLLAEGFAPGTVSGGTLNLANNARAINGTSGVVALLPPTSITVQQHTSTLFADNNVSPSSTLLSPGVRFSISADTVERGGFANLSITAPQLVVGTDTIARNTVFLQDGLNLNLPGTLIINSADLAFGTNAATGTTGSASASAAYLRWNSGGEGRVGLATAAPAGRDFAISLSGQLVDLVGDLGLQNVSRTTINSSTDIRLSGNLVRLVGPTRTFYRGSLSLNGDLTLRAAQVYPTTGSPFNIFAGSRVRIETNGAPAPTPYSAGGTLGIFAPTIEQFGVLRAPIGSITLGCADVGGSCTVAGRTIPATQTLTLGAGSLTSVSADPGQIIPFGVVETTDNTLVLPITPEFVSLQLSPPAKGIALSGSNVAVTTGATVETSGGGDLYASSFLPGTGGTRNVFAAPNSFAILPGYSSQVGIIDPFNGGSASIIGRQVYLTGIPGLAAGTYTLLPGAYAQLPGAFRVTVNSAPSFSSVLTTAAPIAPIAQADGSYLASGYFATSFSGARDAHWSLLRVESGTVARKYTEIADFFGNSFYTAQAAERGTAIPRLPADAGSLSINALRALTFQGQGLSSPAQGGRGGTVDISGNQIAVVTAAQRDANVAVPAPTGWASGVNWNPLLLAADDLNNLGADSLLIGGIRSELSDGTHIAAQASGIVIANGAVGEAAAEALNVGELLLIVRPSAANTTFAFGADPVTGAGGTAVTLALPQAGTGIIDIRDGSVIDTSGRVVQGAQNDLFLFTTSVPQFPTLVGGVSTYTAAQLVPFYTAAAALAQPSLARISSGVLVDTVAGPSPYAGVPTAPISVFGPRIGQGGFATFTGVLPTAAPIGTVNVGNATIRTSGAITLRPAVNTAIAQGATIAASALDLTSSRIALGTNSAGSVLALSQALLNSLTDVRNLVLRSGSTIEFFSGLNVGTRDEDGQPRLNTVVFDAAGLVARPGAGAVEVIAQQVLFENTLGGTVPGTTSPVFGASLNVLAQDVRNGVAEGDQVTPGTNTGRISFGSGSVGVAGFGSINLQSSGLISFGAAPSTPSWSTSISYASGAQAVGANGIVYTSLINNNIGFDPTASASNTAWASTGINAFETRGALFAQAPLTLDAPRITAGSLSSSNGLPIFTQATYTITASNLAAAPSWYDVTLQNSSTATRTLPEALLGSSLTINGGAAFVDTAVVLRGGSFALTANRGDVTLGNNALIDTAGTAITFRDAVVSAGGGTIALTSTEGNLSIGSGAVLDVSVPQTDGATSFGDGEAGSIFLTAGRGTVSLAGSLRGGGESLDKGGSFALDAGVLAGNYDTLAAKLNAGRFTRSWNLRVRSGDITISGLSTARNLTVGADTGSITVASSAVLDASGPTGGVVNLWAGNNLTVDGSIRANGASADAAGKGGQVTLASGTNLPSRWSSAGWSRSADYPAGTQVLGSDGTIYTSLADNNAGHDPTAAGSSAFWSRSGVGVGALSITGTWTGTQSYASGTRIVGSDGVIYVSRVANNSGHDPVADGGVNWTRTGVTVGALPISTVEPVLWDGLAPTYAVGTLVVGPDGNIYRALQANRGIDPTRSDSRTLWAPTGLSGYSFTSTGAYNSAVIYGVGSQIIGSDGRLYISRAAGNFGRDPVTDGGVNWTNSGVGLADLGVANVAGSWTGGTRSYTAGTRVVGADGVIYVAASDNTNRNPTTTSGFWTRTGVTIDAAIELAATNNWSNITTFARGERVVGTDGVTYVSLVDNNAGNNPSGGVNTTRWAATTAASGTLTISSGASIDVSALQVANTTDTGRPTVLTATENTGQITLQTPRSQISGLSVLGNLSGASEVAVVGNETYSGVFTVTPRAFRNTYLVDAAAFAANNESALKTALAANPSLPDSVLHIRPGIEIRNAGAITVLGDSFNSNGIDLSGTNYAGTSTTAYYTAEDYDRYRSYNTASTLTGHFGARLEPVALTIRAGGNLSFGACATASCTRGEGVALALGSISDGFSSFASGLNGASQYVGRDGSVITPPIIGGGASGQAALFDAPSTPGTDAPSSATYRFSAGTSLSAANPLAVSRSSTAQVNVAGFGDALPQRYEINALYNFACGSPGSCPSFIGNTNIGSYVGLNLPYIDTGSLIRTGTGDISVAAAGDVVLRGATSVIYTAGTARNISGTSAQPLGGFTQYTGSQILRSDLLFLDAGSTLLPPAAFGVNGGNLAITAGGDVRGANNRGYNYELTAQGSQLQLLPQVLIDELFGDPILSRYYSSDYLSEANNPLSLFNVTPGLNQLAWYPYTEYFAEGVGALGGGNVTIGAGGRVSNLLAVLPTNARGAGTALSSDVYSPETQSGLYVQGGGALRVTAGADITGVNTYVQNGPTVLKATGSVTPNSIATGTGDVTVIAGGNISISDYSPNDLHTPLIISGISLTQNSSLEGHILSTLGIISNRQLTGGPQYNSFNVAATDLLQGIVTSAPTGEVNLIATGAVTLNLTQSGNGLVNVTDTSGFNNTLRLPVNALQGILPAQLHATSLQGNIINNGHFLTWSAPNGTVDLLARGSVSLNQGFTVSDADPSILPTLSAYTGVFAAFPEGTFLEAQPDASLGSGFETAPLPPQTSFFFRNVTQFLEDLATSNANRFGSYFFGGLAFVAGADVGQAVLEAESRLYSIPSFVSLANELSPSLRASLHAGLHAADSQPVRVYALAGDIRQAASLPGQAEVLPKASSFFAGRDISNLALLGQNNLATDVTSVVAGRDIVYATPRDRVTGLLLGTRDENGRALAPARSVTLAGPGDLLLLSGRNTNLGFSSGVTTVGNAINVSLPGQGANITILAGLGDSTPNYQGFQAEFANAALMSTLDEVLELVDARGRVLDADPYAFLEGLPPAARNLLLNRIFFDLLRDSGRNHTGAAPGQNFQAGYVAVDTVPDTAQGDDTNFERAFAAIDSFLAGTSGTGNFAGVFSQVRTRAGGDINILAPHGKIDVGAVNVPPGFSYGGLNDFGVSNASVLGVVTEQGGTIRAFAQDSISVNQSRIFTLNGGDLIVVSQEGDIDAGRGARTVQAIQPPTITYDLDGNITITPIGAASGSGIATLRGLPTSPVGNADLIAFVGAVNAGEAGIRVSGNINIAAVQVLNAGNIQVGGQSSGVPVVQAPDVGGLTVADKTSAATTKATELPTGQNDGGDRPSIIIVEVLGYGGDDCNTPGQDGGASDCKKDKPN
jgi:filamentous hemagglutinin family protein